MTTHRAPPPGWDRIIEAGPPRADAASPADHAPGALRDAWSDAAGIDPYELRAFAEWLDGRSEDLDQTTAGRGRLAAAVSEALGGGAAEGVLERLHAGSRRVEAHAESLREMATVLRAAAGAVASVRAQQVNALAALGDDLPVPMTPGASGASGPGGMRGLGTQDLADLGGVFSRSCADSVRAMRDIDDALADALADALRAGRPGVAWRGGLMETGEPRV